jgi:hypothetical protein
MLILCFTSLLAYPQDTLKVHFLYGSKPLRKYKDTESKWFGGMLGGHVGIEGDSGKILNFVPRGKFHWFAKPGNKHSAYTEYSFERFYSIMGGDPDSNKKTIVYIPVTEQQKLKFDSIGTAYLKQTPYDYALFGMRCGSAAYDILGQLDILPAYCYSRTYGKYSIPKNCESAFSGRRSPMGGK